MSDQSNETAMIAAGRSSAQSNRAAVAILTSVKGADEAAIAKLRDAFYVGALMGACDIGENAARAYIPDTSAPVGKQCAFKPYPAKAPETFDAAIHRSEDVERAYGCARANWLNCRKAAGLPMLRAGAAKGAQTDKGDAKNAPTRITSVVEVPSKLDTAGALELARNFDVAFAHAMNQNAAHIVGEAGSLLRKLMTDLHEYCADAAKAYASEHGSLAATVANEEQAKALALAEAELAALRAELAAQREAALIAAQAAPKAKRERKGKEAIAA